MSEKPLDVVPLPSVNDSAAYAIKSVERLFSQPVNKIEGAVELYGVELVKELTDAFEAGYQLGRGNR